MEAYRWRGRSQTHVLTSGLDDYPRAEANAGELHLDLISWMGFFTRTMRDIAGFMGNTDDEAMFAETEKAIIDNIDGRAFFRRCVEHTDSRSRLALERKRTDVL